MNTLSATWTIPFTRILSGNDDFVIETGTGSYQLTTGISEHYIMMNLTGEVKKGGKIIVSVQKQDDTVHLEPVGILHGKDTTWIIVTPPDAKTDFPIPENMDCLRPFLCREGVEYPDGFIDSSRTFLTFKQYCKYSSLLKDEYYAKAFYSGYYKDFPHGPYDVRLHYAMVKGIRKHAHYAGDFLSSWVNPQCFYHGWTDPFPWYLYVKIFGTLDSWPSYAKMRLMAGNECREGIPLALKVLRSKKVNKSIQHYAIILAGLDEANDRYILPFEESHPHAFLRVWYIRQSDKFYPCVLENARRIEQGGKDDLLDDPVKVYTSVYNRYEDYTISQRGFVTLSFLMEEQIRELGEIYLGICKKLSKPLSGKERTRLGGALRSFLIALTFNRTPAAAGIFKKIYEDYNTLLYGSTAEKSELGYIDIYFDQFLYSFVEENNLEEDFWNRLYVYAKENDIVYSNHLFLRLFAKSSYYRLRPEDFYALFSGIIREEYTNIVPVFEGVTGLVDGVTDGYASLEGFFPLDHRWSHMFENVNYYAWRERAARIYRLVKPIIEPHPEGWTIEQWYEEHGNDKEGEEYDAEDWDDEDDDIYAYEEFFYEEDEYDGKRETEEIFEDEYGTKTKVKNIHVDANLRREAEQYGRNIAGWVESEWIKENFCVLQKLYWRLRDDDYRTFPDEVDTLVGSMPENTISELHVFLKMLLEKIKQAPEEPYVIDGESRYNFYFKLVKSYLTALTLNPAPAAADFMDYIYHNYNELLYARELDNYNREQEKHWMNYLVSYAEERGLLADLWQRVQSYFSKRHKAEYWNYTHFYIALYGKLAIRMLSSAEFYNNLYKYVESNFMFLETLFRGILSDKYMEENNVQLDVRWQHTFNRWVDDWEFDIVIEIFEEIRDYFPDSVPREADQFFTRYLK